MQILQKFDGVVYEVYGDTFGARLGVVIGEYIGSEFWAEIYINKVPESDRDLILSGGYFTWIITETESIFEFLRLPPFTQDELDAAQIRGKELLELLGGYVNHETKSHNRPSQKRSKQTSFTG